MVESVIVFGFAFSGVSDTTRELKVLKLVLFKDRKEAPHGNERMKVVVNRV